MCLVRARLAAAWRRWHRRRRFQRAHAGRASACTPRPRLDTAHGACQKRRRRVFYRAPAPALALALNLGHGVGVGVGVGTAQCREREARCAARAARACSSTLDTGCCANEDTPLPQRVNSDPNTCCTARIAAPERRVSNAAARQRAADPRVVPSLDFAVAVAVAVAVAWGSPSRHADRWSHAQPARPRA